MKLTIDNIFTRCQDISSYEGGRINDADGNSMYPQVHITGQDRPLVVEYVTQCLSLIETKLYYAISSAHLCDNAVHITFVRDSRLDADNCDTYKSIESVLVSYVMWKWLDDKSPDRAKAWGEIHAEMLRVLPIKTKKNKPVLYDN